jgi:hypothetical protein
VSCCRAPGLYTQDCYDHDVCSGTFGTSVWSGDRNCGDEFWEAASDTAFIDGLLFNVTIYVPGGIPMVMMGCF